MNFKQLAISTTLFLTLSSSFAQTPKGEIKAGPLVHTAESSAGLVNEAQVAFPASLVQGAIYVGPLKDAPKLSSAKVPVVIFMHGS